MFLRLGLKKRKLVVSMSVIYFTYKLEQCIESNTLKYRLFAHRLCLRKYCRQLTMDMEKHQEGNNDYEISADEFLYQGVKRRCR